MKEIDKRVILEVMGWNTCQQFAYSPFEPSINISDAFSVVERMRELGWFMQTRQQDDHHWICWFEERGILTGKILETADTAPLSICKAALKTQ